MSWLRLCLLAGVVFSTGCDVGDEPPPSTQPKDLPAPWVLTTGEEFSMSSRTNDEAGNRVFSLKASEFGGLIENLVDEYSQPLAVNPKEMMDWTLTGSFKGKSQEEVLADIAQQCQLKVGKTSSGVVLISFPGRESQEFVITVESLTEEEAEEE